LRRVRLRQHDQFAIVLPRPCAAREFLRHGWACCHLYKPWMIKPNKVSATPLNISKPISICPCWEWRNSFCARRCSALFSHSIFDIADIGRD
jgi:hypothetical protein